ncbi:TonB-dependent receptor [Pseudomaricurvus alkylphenolicus]|uniref:TonB-dependent receptor n=1 Tax=Pseudomaricurvus alkylphenolicus TaxID=1306991 RepID=UPI00141EB1EB|nr:TonB-dependent receptor [Pseudomaricurvus alkylphenolicus]NIB44071.1 TonB-dependent receptor [Pseudomaricurvus alkylphenolicus]
MELISSIEEIVVSARRKEESLQSVPVSVVAFDADALREANITTTSDLQRAVPGVYLGGSGGAQNPLYVVRGQSKGLIGTTSPAVVSYFAEVPQPAWGSAVPQFDMSNIQVLKGPQGTLFGRNTTGGAILYNPQAPVHELEGYIDLVLGDYQHQRVRGAFNLPIIEDKVALRIAGDINQRDGYTKNVGIGGDLDRVDTNSWRISLLTDVQNFRNTLIVDQYKSDNDGFNISVSETFTPSGLNALAIVDQVQSDAATQRERGPFVNSPSFDQFETNERFSIVNRTEYDFSDNLSFLNIAAYQTTDLAYGPNIDGLGIYDSPVVRGGFESAGLTVSGVESTLVKAVLIDQTVQLSNEIQLRGSAFEDRFEWLVGAFYLKSEPDGSGQVNGTTVFQSRVGTEELGQLYTNGGAQHFFLNDTSKAVFFHGELALTDNLSLEAGVRATEDSFELCLGSGAAPAFNGERPAEVSERACRQRDSSKIVNAAVVEQESNATTWSLGLNWQISDEFFTYIVARHGYRAGGANGPIFDGDLSSYQTFDPEIVDDYEFGLRADWNLGSVPLRTNISYFEGEYSNAQADLAGGVTTPQNCNLAVGTNIGPDGDCDGADDPTGGAIVLNVGDTAVSGVDIEFQAMLTDNFSVSLNATVQDADIKKLDAQSNEFIESRKHSAIPFLHFANSMIQANMNYTVPFGAYADEFSLNVNHYRTADTGRKAVPIRAYHLTNVRADWRGLAGTRMDVAVYVNNVTDEVYASSPSMTSEALGVTAFVYGPPRMWGVEARYNF